MKRRCSYLMTKKILFEEYSDLVWKGHHAPEINRENLVSPSTPPHMRTVAKRRIVAKKIA